MTNKQIVRDALEEIRQDCLHKFNPNDYEHIHENVKTISTALDNLIDCDELVKKLKAKKKPLLGNEDYSHKAFQENQKRRAEHKIIDQIIGEWLMRWWML